MPFTPIPVDPADVQLQPVVPTTFQVLSLTLLNGGNVACTIQSSHHQTVEIHVTVDEAAELRVGSRYLLVWASATDGVVAEMVERMTAAVNPAPGPDEAFDVTVRDRPLSEATDSLIVRR